jgi:hypothetical protein
VESNFQTVASTGSDLPTPDFQHPTASSERCFRDRSLCACLLLFSGLCRYQQQRADVVPQSRFSRSELLACCFSQPTEPPGTADERPEESLLGFVQEEPKAFRSTFPPSSLYLSFCCC